MISIFTGDKLQIAIYARGKQKYSTMVRYTKKNFQKRLGKAFSKLLKRYRNSRQDWFYKPKPYSIAHDVIIVTGHKLKLVEPVNLGRYPTSVSNTYDTDVEKAIDQALVRTLTVVHSRLFAKENIKSLVDSVLQ